ncbi:hypothetical protein RHSP_32322 [Rhizobium freirei PRF 81]|uniref:Uncharacterized protein n=1 Tax=Rhizobium freirei PRF 81 TaxID=363754 RepID=N6UWS6_9HYPH|nr:hypothetical protein RHSP_32322 [Rhizobium freirei PRF 81]
MGNSIRAFSSCIYGEIASLSFNCSKTILSGSFEARGRRCAACIHSQERPRPPLLKPNGKPDDLTQDKGRKSDRKILRSRRGLLRRSGYAADIYRPGRRIAGHQPNARRQPDCPQLGDQRLHADFRQQPDGCRRACRQLRTPPHLSDRCRLLCAVLRWAGFCQRHRRVRYIESAARSRRGSRLFRRHGVARPRVRRHGAHAGFQHRRLQLRRRPRLRADRLRPDDRRFRLAVDLPARGGLGAALSWLSFLFPARIQRSECDRARLAGRTQLHACADALYLWRAARTRDRLERSAGHRPAGRRCIAVPRLRHHRTLGEAADARPYSVSLSAFRRRAVAGGGTRLCLRGTADPAARALRRHRGHERDRRRADDDCSFGAASHPADRRRSYGPLVQRGHDLRQRSSHFRRRSLLAQPFRRRFGTAGLDRSAADDRHRHQPAMGLDGWSRRERCSERAGRHGDGHLQHHARRRRRRCPCRRQRHPLRPHPIETRGASGRAGVGRRATARHRRPCCGRIECADDRSRRADSRLWRCLQRAALASEHNHDDHRNRGFLLPWSGSVERCGRGCRRIAGGRRAPHIEGLSNFMGRSGQQFLPVHSASRHDKAAIRRPKGAESARAAQHNVSQPHKMCAPKSDRPRSSERCEAGVWARRCYIISP